jgi:hypothetical protein
MLAYAVIRETARSPNRVDRQRRAVIGDVSRAIDHSKDDIEQIAVVGADARSDKPVNLTEITRLTWPLHAQCCVATARVLPPRHQSF